jgi:hypothetical protein
MLAIQVRSSEEMRNRLKTASMGLGLVRLLQDARRFDEAKLTLSLLEYGCDGEQSDNASQLGKKPYRVQSVSRAAATKNDAA